MASDDEDDLEALRMAALASLKRKRDDSNSSQVSVETVPVTSSAAFNNNIPPNQNLGYPAYQQYPQSQLQSHNQTRNWGNNRRPYRGRGRGSVWNPNQNTQRSCLIVLTQEEPKKEEKKEISQESSQPSKSLLIRPQDKWASGLSDENSQSSTPTRPKDKFSRYNSSDSEEDSDNKSDESDYEKEDKVDNDHSDKENHDVLTKSDSEQELHSPHHSRSRSLSSDYTGRRGRRRKSSDSDSGASIHSNSLNISEEKSSQNLSISRTSSPGSRHSSRPSSRASRASSSRSSRNSSNSCSRPSSFQGRDIDSQENSSERKRTVSTGSLHSAQGGDVDFQTNSSERKRTVSTGSRHSSTSSAKSHQKNDLAKFLEKSVTGKNCKSLSPDHQNKGKLGVSKTCLSSNEQNKYKDGSFASSVSPKHTRKHSLSPRRGSLSPRKRSWSPSPKRRNSLSPKMRRRSRSFSSRQFSRSRSRSPRSKGVRYSDSQQSRRRRSFSHSPSRSLSPAFLRRRTPSPKFRRSRSRSFSPKYYRQSSRSLSPRYRYRSRSSSPPRRRRTSLSVSPARRRRSSRSFSPGRKRYRSRSISPRRRRSWTPLSQRRSRSLTPRKRRSPSFSPRKRSWSRSRSRSFHRSPVRSARHSPYSRNSPPKKRSSRSPPLKLSRGGFPGRSPRPSGRSVSPSIRRSWSPKRERKLSPQHKSPFSQKNSPERFGKNFSKSGKNLSYNKQPPLDGKTKENVYSAKNSEKSHVVDKLLEIAGQKRHPDKSEKIPSLDDRNKNKYSFDKLDKKSLKGLTDEQLELFEARKRKFEASSEVSNQKKTISLKGIVPKKKVRSTKKGKESTQNVKKSDISTVEKHSIKETDSKKKGNEMYLKSKKISPSKRKSRESVKSNRISDNDSDSDVNVNQNALSDDSESDSNDDSWRNKKASATERNRDDIELERRKRMLADQEREKQERRAKQDARKRHEETEKLQKKMEKEDLRSGKGKNKVETFRREKLKSVDRSEKEKPESALKEHRRKRFVELEGSEDESLLSGKSSLSSLVLTKKSKMQDRETVESKKDVRNRMVVSRDESSSDSGTGKSLSKTDARHLIRRTVVDNDSSGEELGKEMKKTSYSGRESPVVIFKFDSGSKKEEKTKYKDTATLSRLSVHARLGLPVDKKVTKRSKREVTEYSPEPKRKKSKRSAVHNDIEPGGSDLDARIQIIKKRNAEIERREREIKKDKETYG